MPRARETAKLASGPCNSRRGAQSGWHFTKWGPVSSRLLSSAVIGRLVGSDARAAVLNTNLLLHALHSRPLVCLRPGGDLDVGLDAALDGDNGGVPELGHHVARQLRAAAAVLAGDDDAGHLVLELLVCGATVHKRCVVRTAQRLWDTQVAPSTKAPRSRQGAVQLHLGRSHQRCSNVAAQHAPNISPKAELNTGFPSTSSAMGRYSLRGPGVGQTTSQCRAPWRGSLKKGGLARAPVQAVPGAVLRASADVEEGVALVVDQRLRGQGP